MKGDILRSASIGSVLHGKNGTILYYDGFKKLEAQISVSWGDNYDVDCCAWFYLNNGQGFVDSAYLGWNYGNTETTMNGVKMRWTGDVTSPGVEAFFLSSDGRIDPKNIVFMLGTNWYRSEYGAQACRVHCGGKSITIYPSNRKGQRADINDPGVRITFDSQGNVDTITPRP